MTRIGEKFQTLRVQHRSALVPYITPEFPVRGTTVPLVLALETAGADLVELGVPFSDPIADGPTIQHSSAVALRNGVTLGKVLDLVHEIRKKSEIPIVLMGYCNSFLRYGVRRFFGDAKTVGVDGLIVPDLPPEEAVEVMRVAGKNGIGMTFLIAPTTPVARIKKIDKLSTDFSYCVSITGVTGARRNLGAKQELLTFLKRVEANTKKPFVVGFGISRIEQVREVCRYADGAVVGSALIRAMEGCTSVTAAVRAAREFFRSLQS
ncbi:MAG: tryptophan synthase subunit alpha [Bacteroidota bacterium]